MEFPGMHPPHPAPPKLGFASLRLRSPLPLEGGESCWVRGVAALVMLLTLFIAAAPAFAEMPKIRHVFIIVLENKSFEKTFGPDSPAPYLAKELVPQGALLTQYYGIGHFSLDNYVAMISGQAPNPATQSDCQAYLDFAGTTIDADGQAVGQGCVYPPAIKTIADQLEAAGFSWKGYMQDMGKDPAREEAACGRPKTGENGRDLTQKAAPQDGYAARHNPFVYFHSIVDRPVCSSNVVNLAALKADLAEVATTSNYVFITPDLCHDGHDRKCVNGENEPGGLASADRFLKEWIPLILASPAFRQDGLLIVTFDEADVERRLDPATGKTEYEVDAAACCDEPPGPNIGTGNKVFAMADKGPGVAGPGGGRIGAVLLSPLIKPGTVSNEPYNHYALLRSVETIFGLPYLGYAARPGLQTFGSDVFAR
jgi:phosphatidylinositol-3-phosphatase